MHFRDIVRAEFPTAPPPNDDPASVRGNVSREDKQLNLDILAYHVANAPGSRVFGRSEGKGLKMVEIWVSKVGMGTEAEFIDAGDASALQQPLQSRTVCEITVEEGMLNVHGTLAGACAMMFLDICTFTAIFALAVLTGIDMRGVSTAMNTTWYSPALPGTELRIVSTSLSSSSRVAAARCEIYDKKTKRLLVSAVQTMAPLNSKRSKGVQAKL